MFRPFALAVTVATLATAVSAQENQPGGAANPTGPAVQNPIQLFPPEAAVTQAAPVGVTGGAVAGATAFGTFFVPALAGVLVIGAVSAGGSSSDTQ